MPFAAVNEVDLEGRELATDLKILEEGMIPMMKGFPGFRSARFLRSLDGKRGVGTVIFDSEAHARAAIETMRTNRPAEAPPTRSGEVYEVIAEA